MTISKIIKELTRCRNKYGDVPLFLSCDSEGNSFGTVELDSFCVDEYKVILYPFHEHMDIDELPGDPK